MRWQARTVDLDLLLYDDLQIDTPALTIPHPRFAFRRFAVEPAAEIAADMMHPTVQLDAGRSCATTCAHARPYVAITGSGRHGQDPTGRGIGRTFCAAQMIAFAAIAAAGPAASRIWPGVGLGARITCGASCSPVAAGLAAPRPRWWSAIFGSGSRWHYLPTRARRVRIQRGSGWR